MQVAILRIPTQLTPGDILASSSGTVASFLENREMFSHNHNLPMTYQHLNFTSFKREKGGNQQKNPPKKRKKRRETPNFAYEVGFGGGGVGRKKKSKRKKIDETGWWFQIFIFSPPFGEMIQIY